jgi:hypothetical protein
VADDDYPPTPPPLVSAGAMPGHPPRGRAAYPNPPNYGGALPPPQAPWGVAPPMPAPSNLRAPETIDFAAPPVYAPQVAARRSGPPGWLVLIFCVGAAVGGVKLAQFVTRGDMARLDAQANTASPSSPTK